MKHVNILKSIEVVIHISYYTRVLYLSLQAVSFLRSSTNSYACLRVLTHAFTSFYMYLLVFTGRLFPEEFYSFLRVFMVRFASLPVLTPDEKIARYGNVSDIFSEEKKCG